MINIDINKTKFFFVKHFQPTTTDALSFARAALLVDRKTQLVTARGRDRGPAAVHMRKCKLQVSELKVHDS
jgi:hypothetical protein